MTDWNQSSGLERRAFLSGATLAGVASVLAPGAALGQTSPPIAPVGSKKLKQQKGGSSPSPA
jgi:hypothetical protein